MEACQIDRTRDTEKTHLLGHTLRMNRCYLNSPTPIILLALVASLGRFTYAQSSPESKKSSEKFKSVSILTEMPADQMGKVMNMMSASLGVNCNFCHEGTNFAKETVGKKDVARKMLEMTLGLNRDFFQGRVEVNCYTCHRGQSQPSTTLALDRAKPVVPPIQSEKMPSANDIFAKHATALGGPEKPVSIKTLHVIAKRIEPNGAIEPEELWQTASGLSRMVTQYGSIAVVEGFDGTSAWKRANDNVIALKSDEAEQIRIEAAIAFASESLPSRYSKAAFKIVDRVDGREVYVLTATSEGKLEERLYFDVQTGLLSRRIASVPTVLGAFEFQVTYRDYREFEGRRHPTLIQFAIPNITWTRQVTAIETNVQFDDSLFQKSK